MLGRRDSILPRCGRGGHCRETRVGPWLSSASRERARDRDSGRVKGLPSSSASISSEAKLSSPAGGSSRSSRRKPGSSMSSVCLPATGLPNSEPSEAPSGTRLDKDIGSSSPRARQAMFAGPIIDLKSYRSKEEKAHDCARRGRRDRCPRLLPSRPFSPLFPRDSHRISVSAGALVRPRRPFRYT